MLTKPSISTLIAMVLLTSPAFAQNGAEIIRGQNDAGFFDWDGNETLIVAATDLYFWCGDEVDNYPYDFMAVVRPDGTVKGRESGSAFARVYQPATPDDFFAEGPCAFINEGPLVAEGIISWAGNDNDVFQDHPKRTNTWGFTANGTLYDVAGNCASGMTDVLLIRKFQYFMNCEEDCFVPRVMKGPELSCAE